MTPQETREQDLGRLMSELEMLRRTQPSRGSHPLGEFKLIEIAAARLDMYASYAYRLLNSPFIVPVERKTPGKVRHLPSRGSLAR